MQQSRKGSRKTDWRPPASDAFRQVIVSRAGVREMVRAGRLVRLMVAAGAALLSLTPVSGCSSPVSPPFGAPYSQTDLVEGTGTPINDGLSVMLNYTGWLYDPTKPNNKGAVLDTTVGAAPVDVLVGGQF